MKEELELLGWKMYYECSPRCGRKQYFMNATFKDFEVVVRSKAKTFTITLKKHTIAGPFHGYQLKEKLNQYVK